MIESKKYSYWGKVKQTWSSLFQGLKLSMRHFYQAKAKRKPYAMADGKYFEQKTGRITLQYPKESLPVPDNGRYQLHNEIDDCIVCDKCVKVCPVNCIEIDPIRSPESFGETSDGTSKRIYAAKFDIDMAKCCFCGLCTTVCPTECLTMTDNYDFSAFDFKNHNFSFADMTAENIKQKQKEWDKHQEEKEAVKREIAKAKGSGNVASKPQFKPKVKTSSSTDQNSAHDKALELMKNKTTAASSTKKPVFKPKVKVKPKNEGGDENVHKAAKPKPMFRPKIKPKLPPKNNPEKKD